MSDILSSPKFTKHILIKSTSGKTGAILDSQGDVPYYNYKWKTWMYPWGYGLGGTSEGVIPETMIKEYYDVETKKWVSSCEVILEILHNKEQSGDSQLKQCGECNKMTAVRYNGAAYCSDWCWSK